MTPRQKERRDRILRVTREQIAKEGYEGIVMRELAVEAGVSPTTLYKLYETKDKLVVAALREQLKFIVFADEEKDANALARIKGMFDRIVQSTLDEPKYTHVMMRQLYRAEGNDEIVKLALGNSISNLSALVQQAQQEGLLKPEVNVQALSRDLLGAVWYINFLWHKDFVALNDLPRQVNEGFFNKLQFIVTDAGQQVLDTLAAQDAALV